MSGGKGLAGVWFGGNMVFLGTLLAIFDEEPENVFGGLGFALVGLIVFAWSSHRGR